MNNTVWELLQAVNHFLSLDSVCIKSTQSRLRFHQSTKVFSTSSLSSWLRWIKNSFFFLFFCTSMKEATCQKWSQTFHRCSSQTNKKTVEDGLWNMKAFRAILLLLEGCPLFWKGVSSKQTPVTLPILLPIKIYWKHPGNTAQLISSQLACQKQANIAIRRIKRILPLPFEFITGI